MRNTVRTTAALATVAALVLAFTAPSCGRSQSCTDDFTLENCGEHCSDIGLCEHSCSETDCRKESAVCAEGNGTAECVLPARDACTPTDVGVYRCNADKTAVHACGETGFFHLYSACNDTETCFVSPDGSAGWCALLPVTDCSNDLQHSECRGLVHVSCAFDAHVLIGQACPNTCVAHTNATEAGYECD